MQQPFSFILARRRAVPLLLACAAGVFLLLRMRRGYYYLSFGDEVEHLIGARVLNAGGRLYRDFIDEHGPLPYAVAQLVDLVTRGSHPAWVRLIPMLAAAGMIASVALSRCLCGMGERLLAVALLMSMLASIWIVQGLCLYDYQLLAGACLVIAAALDAAPAWTGRTAPAPACAAAGAAYVLSGFVAYSYIPAAVLLCASGRLGTPARPGAWRALGLGAGAACLLIAGWSARYLDPVGYVAFHFYMNQEVFAPFVSYSPRLILTVLIPDGYPQHLIQACGTVAGALGLLLLFAGHLRTWRTASTMLLALAALILSNPRGSPIFQNAAFMVLAFALLALGLARSPRAFRHNAFWPAGATAAGLVLAALLETVARHALSTPDGLTRQQLVRLPLVSIGESQDPWARRLRRVVQPDERVLAIPFNPHFYLFAGRLPMRGYYDYLPWEAAYAARPFPGRPRDLCTDIARDPPAAIFYDAWVVWDRYDPEHYMGCVTAFLRAHYLPATGAPHLFMRRDKLAAWNASAAPSPKT